MQKKTKHFITFTLLVMLLGRMFKLPARREQNFIAGLSMGGYGALFLGLSRPDLYAGCASFTMRRRTITGSLSWRQSLPTRFRRPSRTIMFSMPASMGIRCIL